VLRYCKRPERMWEDAVCHVTRKKWWRRLQVRVWSCQSATSTGQWAASKRLIWGDMRRRGSAPVADCVRVNWRRTALQLLTNCDVEGLSIIKTRHRRSRRLCVKETAAIVDCATRSWRRADTFLTAFDSY